MSLNTIYWTSESFSATYNSALLIKHKIVFQKQQSSTVQLVVGIPCTNRLDSICEYYLDARHPLQALIHKAIVSETKVCH